MLIKTTEKFKKIRKMSVPGKFLKDEFDKLQAGKTVDVNDDVGRFLVKHRYAEMVEPVKEKTAKGVK